MEDVTAGIENSKLSLSADQREELASQARQQNWDFECPEMVVMLSAGIDPTQPDGRDRLPQALREASWSRPVPSLGYVAVVRLRLADFVESLSCECVEKIEDRYNYRPLE